MRKYSKKNILKNNKKNIKSRNRKKRQFGGNNLEGVIKDMHETNNVLGGMLNKFQQHITELNKHMQNGGSGEMTSSGEILSMDDLPMSLVEEKLTAALPSNPNN